MDDGRGRDRLAVLGRPLPGSFERRVVVTAPGRQRAFDDAEWRDALVVVERGEIELGCQGGTCWRFGRCDVLWVIGLPVRTPHNPGREPAVLAAVPRRRRGGGGTTP
jgi:hypothetical protein